MRLKYRAQTENYAIYIPINYIYGDENKFVYVVEEREGILGTEWKVQSVRVNILDQNENIAAVESAGITADSRIVRYTTMPLTDGATVRLVE